MNFPYIKYRYVSLDIKYSCIPYTFSSNTFMWIKYAQTYTQHCINITLSSSCLCILCVPCILIKYANTTPCGEVFILALNLKLNFSRENSIEYNFSFTTFNVFSLQSMTGIIRIFNQYMIISTTMCLGAKEYQELSKSILCVG